MSIEHLAYRIAHDFMGGVAGLADMMGKVKAVLYNKLNPNMPSHFLTIGEFEMLGDFTAQNLAIAAYFAEKADAVVVGLPDRDEVVGDMNLLEAFATATVNDGEFAKQFMAAISDGRVTPVEREELRKQMFRLISARLALLSKIEGLM